MKTSQKKISRAHSRGDIQYPGGSADASAARPWGAIQMSRGRARDESPEREGGAQAPCVNRLALVSAEVVSLPRSRRRGRSAHIKHGIQTIHGAAENPAREGGAEPTDRVAPTLLVAPQISYGSADSVHIPRGIHSASDRVRAIAAIQDLHKRYRVFMGAEGDMTRRIKSAEKRAAGARMIREGLEPPEDKMPTVTPADTTEVEVVYAGFYEARKVLAAERNSLDKERRKLAKDLPALAWVESVRGFGVGVFCDVVGECGDLSNYPNHRHLWKRMGLGLVDGQTQKAMQSDAEKSGYNKRRRSIAYVLSENLMKLGSPNYRPIYDGEKQKKLEAGQPKLRAHLHGLRLTAKAALRDLWRAWRDETNWA